LELLEFILSTTYFTFRGQIYRQTFGTAMGNPVSSLVANMYMEHLEQKPHDTAPVKLKPKLWKRYVNDILEVAKRGSMEKLTEFSYKLDTSGSILFTYEVEQVGKLPFMDLRLVRNNNGALKLRIYRKSTHTDQYLNSESYHPVEHKISVVRFLLQRSQTLMGDNQDKIEENMLNVSGVMRNSVQNLIEIE